MKMILVLLFSIGAFADDQTGPALKNARAIKFVELNVLNQVVVSAGSYLFKCDAKNHCENNRDPRITIDVDEVLVIDKSDKEYRGEFHP